MQIIKPCGCWDETIRRYKDRPMLFAWGTCMHHSIGQIDPDNIRGIEINIKSSDSPRQVSKKMRKALEQDE